MSQMNLKSIYWCFLTITNLSGALILMLTLTLTIKSIKSVTETPARCLLSLWHRLHLIPRSERTPSFISFCLPYFSESVPCRSRNKPLCDVTKCTGTKMAPLPGLVSTHPVWYLLWCHLSFSVCFLSVCLLVFAGSFQQMAKYAVFCGLRSVGSCLDNLSRRSGDLKIGIT